MLCLACFVCKRTGEDLPGKVHGLHGLLLSRMTCVTLHTFRKIKLLFVCAHVAYD